MPLAQGKPTVNMLELLDEDLPMPLLHFFQSKNGYYVPATLKLFQTMVLAQLFYGTLVAPLPSFMFHLHGEGIIQIHQSNSADNSL